MTTFHRCVLLGCCAAALWWIPGCPVTCEEAAAAVGLSGGPLNTIARAFVEDHETKPPHGTCGANTFGDLSLCQGAQEADIAKNTGIVCSQAATAKKVIQNQRAPFYSNNFQAYLRVTPIAGFDGRARVGAAIAAECFYQIDHLHDGAGRAAAEGGAADGGGQDPPSFVDQQYLATFDFELEATAESTIRYWKGGGLDEVDIDAGSKCTSTGLTYSGCRKVRDGGACNTFTELVVIDPDAKAPPVEVVPGG